MRLICAALSLGLGLFALSAGADPSAGTMDRGRRLTDWFLAGDLAQVFSAFDRNMQVRMDAEALAAFRATVADQIGEEAEPLRERVVTDGPYAGYERLSRFDGHRGDVQIRWSLDGAGQVAGFSVQLLPSPAPSPYLEYDNVADLRLPFDGEWSVTWGGRSVEDNYHAANRNQRFAYDFVRRENGRSFRSDGERNRDYYAWRQPIRAAADGVVVVAVDGVPDNDPGTMNPRLPAGNHVILDHGNGEFSVSAHLARGSVRVAAGDTVQSGEMIGRCGNSGNSSEPHLHFHLQNQPAFGRGDGLPSRFRSYRAVRNEVESASETNSTVYVQEGEPVRGERVSPAAVERPRPRRVGS